MENQSYWEQPAPAKICFSEEWPELTKWMVRAFKLLDVQALNSAVLRLPAEGTEGTQQKTALWASLHHLNVVLILLMKKTMFYLKYRYKCVI